MKTVLAIIMMCCLLVIIIPDYNPNAPVQDPFIGEYWIYAWQGGNTGIGARQWRAVDRWGAKHRRQWEKEALDYYRR